MPTLSEIRAFLGNPHSVRDPEAFMEQLVTNHGMAAPNSLDRSRRVARVRAFLEAAGLDVIVCDWSGRLGLLEDSWTTGGGEVITGSSRDQESFTCGSCDEIYHEDDATRVEGANLCRSCRDDEAYLCEECDDWIFNSSDHSHDDEDDDEDYDVGESFSLREYNCDVTQVLIGFRAAEGESLPPDPLWLGVELEVVPKRSISMAQACRATLDKVQDFAILKHDGSLPSGGFEIVTVPGTLAWHRQAWQPFFAEKVNQLLRSWDVRDRGEEESACGLHVHVSRDAILPLQLGKMLVFVNNPHNSEFMKTIAGRYHTAYAAYDHNMVIGRGWRRPQDHPHSYPAVALGRHAHTRGKTVELRIFRGNVSQEGFFRCLEFAHALVRYTATCGIGEMQWKDFIRWYERPWVRKAYPALTKRLRHREWLVVNGRLEPEAEPV